MAEQTTPIPAKKRTSTGDAFASVAFWEFMAFVLLACFIWVSEYYDLPALVFGGEKTTFSWLRACILTAGVITAGIVAVGNTYLRHRAVLKKMLTSCIYCHRVQHEDGTWERVDEFFMRHYSLDVNPGTCADCQKMVAAVGDDLTKL